MCNGALVLSCLWVYPLYHVTPASAQLCNFVEDFLTSLVHRMFSVDHIHSLH